MLSGTTALFAIAAMALITYATRAGGIWLMSRTTPSPALRAWLDHVPGAVLVSIVAPLALWGGPVTIAGAAVTILVMLRTRQFILAAAAGVLVVCALRWFM